MSMMFSGDRDFAFEQDGVSYYRGLDGESFYRDDGFSLDGISEEEFVDAYSEGDEQCKLEDIP